MHQTETDEIPARIYIRKAEIRNNFFIAEKI